MAFANTNSIVDNDVNNMLRGLSRDNADSAHTGDTNETDLSSVSITGGTMGATGLILSYAAGTITGTAGTKTIRMDFGATTIATITHAAGTTLDWSITAKISNTATGAQRIEVWRTADDGLAVVFDYSTAAIDTTANVTHKVTAQLGASGDTVTQTKFETYVNQIT